MYIKMADFHINPIPVSELLKVFICQTDYCIQLSVGVLQISLYSPAEGHLYCFKLAHLITQYYIDVYLKGVFGAIMGSAKIAKIISL